VTIIPETEVTGVVPANGGYTVLTRKSTGMSHPSRKYRAGGVVFSGGVMGTVPLLMKCRQQGLLPNLSPQLGNFVRTNSEAILAMRSNDRDTNWNDQIAITSGIHPDDDTHMEIVRYNKGSDVLFGLMSLLTDGGGPLPRQLKFVKNVARHPLTFLKHLWIPGAAAQTSVLLVMQTSENHLHMKYRKRWWRFGGWSMNSTVPSDQMRVPSYIPIANEVARRMAVKMNGTPCSSWEEILMDAPTTAHILGGCAMAGTPENGVVGYNGEVFGYPNLYVADGSIVPANLGVNPSLTITALSEYVMSQMAPKN